MSRKRNDGFSEAIVGLFMIAVLALLVYFTIVISGVDVLQGREKVTVDVSFTTVGGLKSHDSVMYRGTKVGAVEDIIISTSNLLARIEIDKSVILRDSYRISICNLSMLGGNYLMLEEGEGEIVDMTAGVLRGETPTDWMRDVSNIAKNLNALTSRAELESIITNIEEVSAVARTLADRLERGEGTLGKLLSSDDAVYKDLAVAVADAKTTLANASEISDRLKNGEGMVGKLLSSDETVYTDLKESVAAFKKAMAAVNLPENFGQNVGELAASANTLIGNLNEVAEKIKNGEGTLGKLATDREMYDEVQGAIRDVRQVLDNYRDTTPISTFGSLIMGGL